MTISGLVGCDSLELHCLVVTVSGLVVCDSLQLDCLSWLGQSLDWLAVISLWTLVVTVSGLVGCDSLGTGWLYWTVGRDRISRQHLLSSHYQPM